MAIPKNAPLTPAGRERMVRRVIAGQSAKAVAASFGVCVKTVNKWVARFPARGAAGRIDRSARPLRLRRPTAAATIERIAALRPHRWTGQQIAREVNLAPATVSRVLARLGLNQLSAPEPAAPVVRYERAHPGGMIPLDIKQRGRFDRVGHPVTGERAGQRNSRGIGGEFVHVCVDDAARIAFSQIMPDARKESATVFLKAALAYHKGLGVTVTRVMTDNGSCYNAFEFRDACRDLGLKHIKTKPCTPKTTGKSRPHGPSAHGRDRWGRPGPSASSRPPCGNGPRPNPLPP